MMKPHFDNHSMQEAMRLAGTPAGKELIGLLNGQDRSQLQKAVASGDTEQMKQAMEALLSSPQAKALMEQLRRQSNG